MYTVVNCGNLMTNILTLFSAWRKAIRRIWKIPFIIHNKLVNDWNQNINKIYNKVDNLLCM